ncbi:hypothetical protein ACHAXS_011695 [Conticribra weissflogii]
MSENTRGRHFVVRPATERLSSSGNVVSNTLDDQPVLMEARLLEIISSVCQLIHSNQQIDEALQEYIDDDLLNALKENVRVIASKKEVARSLQLKLSRHGVNISLEDKIPPYDGSAVLKKIEEIEMKKNTNQCQSNESDDGLYL